MGRCASGYHPDQCGRRVRFRLMEVLASVFSCVCCCVLAMLAKRQKGLEEDCCSPTLVNVAVGVLAALIAILLLVIICPIDSDFLSGAKEWNKGTTTLTSTSSDGAT